MQTLFYRGNVTLNNGDTSLTVSFPDTDTLEYNVSDRISSSNPDALNIGIGIETFRSATSFTKLLNGQVDGNGPYIYYFDIYMEMANPPITPTGTYQDVGQMASGLWEDMGEPTNITVPYISGWLETNVGRLNNYIATSYNGAYGGGISPNLGQEERDIFKMLFWYNFYSRALVQSLGAASVDPIIEVQDDGSLVRVINKNELSKTWYSAKQDVMNDIKFAVKLYKENQANPSQLVEYDAQKAIYKPDIYRLYYQRLV